MNQPRWGASVKFQLLFAIAMPAIAIPVVVAAPAAAQVRAVPRIVIAKADNDRDMLSGGWGFGPGYRSPRAPLIAPIIGAHDNFHGIAFFTRGSQVYVDLMRDTGGADWHFSAGPVLGAGLADDGYVDDRRTTAARTTGIALGAGGYLGVTRTGVVTGDDALTFRLSYVRGLGNLAGEAFTPAIDYATPVSRKLLLGVSVSADYARPRRGWRTVNVTGFTDIALTGDLRHGLLLLLAVGRGRMEGDFVASPVTQIAGNPDQVFGAVGLGYAF